MKDLIVTDEFKSKEFYLLARLPILVGKDYLLIKLSSVMYIEADGCYSKVFTTQKETHFQTSKNLGYYEKIMPCHSFFRVHNKYVVNLNEIKMIQRDHHWSLVLTDKSIIRVSDDKKEILLKKLGLKFDSLNEITD
ncbi:MAG: LytTR family DNA-binding domain-containing protein [Bacteroidota bacterium]